MEMNGKALAEAILTDLTTQVTALKAAGVTPTLAVILAGDDPESLAYIRQKQKATERIGGKFIFEQLPKTTLPKELAARIQMYNNDPSVHGLIVQRPLPATIGDTTAILHTVVAAKDVDGFVPNSPFDVPIAKAVLDILEHIFELSSPRRRGSALVSEYQNRFPIRSGMTFAAWLQAQNIVIIGRGETAGKPVAAAFAKRQCTTSIIHSKTANPKEIMKQADILISCAGKKDVVTPDAIKRGSILISVGLWRDSEGKLHGDYDEGMIKDIAAFYTPTPGGVGPLNIASLMQNLTKACTINS